MEEKIYFKPGDCVTLRLCEVMYSPAMLVLGKELDLESNFYGLRCRWFTDSGLLLEAVFNTKDLILIS